MATLTRAVDQFESDKGMIAGKEYTLEGPNEGDVFYLSQDIDTPYGQGTAGYNLGYIQNGQLNYYDPSAGFKDVANNIYSNVDKLAKSGLLEGDFYNGAEKTYNIGGQNIKFRAVKAGVGSGGQVIYNYEAVLPNGQVIKQQSTKSPTNLDNYNYLAQAISGALYGDSYKDFQYFRGQANYGDFRSANTQAYLNALGSQYGGLNTYNMQQLSQYFPNAAQAQNADTLNKLYAAYKSTGNPQYIKEAEKLIGEGSASYQDIINNPTQVPSNLQGIERPETQFQTYDPKTGQLLVGEAAQQSIQPTDKKVQVQNANGETITVYESSIPQLMAEGVIAKPGAPTSSKYLANEGELQAAREELAKMGIPPAEWGKYISSPDANGKIFYTRPASSTDKFTGNVSSNQTGGGASMNVETMTGDQNAYKMPNVTPGSSGAEFATEAEAMVNNFNKYMELMNQTTGEQKELEQDKTDITAKINEILGDLTKQGSDQLAKEQELGIPQKQQALAQLNTQIETRLAQYKDFMQSLEGKPITMSSIIGEQAQVEKKMLSELGILQARAAGLTGEIQTAQAIADRAIDLKYSTLETTLKVYEAQLGMIKEDLDKEEEKVWKAQQLMLDDIRTAQAEAKTAEKNIQSIALTALANGADSRLVDMISNAKSEIEAATIAGELLNSGGWQYVATPAQRDSLRSQGYEIMQAGGRTYAKRTELMDDLLSPSEAKTLGVPYGTSRQAAINMGITPQYVGSGGGGGGSSGGSTVASGETSGGGIGYIDKNTGKPLKLTATQSNTLSGFDNTLQSSQKALEILGSNGNWNISTGPVAAKEHSARKLLGNADPNLLVLEQTIGKIKAEFMKAISGAAVSDQEVKRLSAFLPSIDDQEQVLRSKLETLIYETQNSKSNFLNTLNAQQPEPTMTLEQQPAQTNNVNTNQPVDSQPEEGFWRKTMNWLFGD